MKLTFLTIAALASILVGCNVKTDAKKEVDEAVRKTEQTIQQLEDPLSLHNGGQPGKITVTGVAVKNENDELKLDSRIQVEQIVGKPKPGTAPAIISDKNKAVLSEATDTNTTHQPSGSTKYINMGCEDIPESEIEGLELDSTALVSTDSSLFLSAKKIFICGKNSLDYSFVNITADEIVLLNSNLTIKADIGDFTVTTQKITLFGNNTIGTLGVDSTLNIFPAPSLKLSILVKIEGDGSLLIASKGGNYIPKDAVK